MEVWKAGQETTVAEHKIQCDTTNFVISTMICLIIINIVIIIIIIVIIIMFSLYIYICLDFIQGACTEFLDGLMTSQSLPPSC